MPTWATPLPLVLLVVAGCTHWRMAPVTADQMVAATLPMHIRVTLTDDSVLVLKNPVVVLDSIVGQARKKRISIPSNRITRTEIPVPQEGDDFFRSWREQRDALRQVNWKQPDRLRLTLTDGSVLVFKHPVSVGDSVFGLIPQTSGGSVYDTSAVASARIVRTETRELSWKMPVACAVMTLSYIALLTVLCQDDPCE